MSNHPFKNKKPRSLPPRRWADKAACAGISPNQFFRNDGEQFQSFFNRVGKFGETLSCPPDCPVMKECALDALESSDSDTVRGGVYIYASQYYDKYKESRRRLEKVVDSL